MRAVWAPLNFLNHAVSRAPASHPGSYSQVFRAAFTAFLVAISGVTPFGPSLSWLMVCRGSVPPSIGAPTNLMGIAILAN